jgi:hypothetical protein
MGPIRIEDKSPTNKTYVLVRYTGGNWHDPDHQEGCVWKVAKFISGISKDERRLMSDCDRKKTYKRGDEHANNKRPYEFEEFGPGALFGQDVDYWMPLPEI